MREDLLDWAGDYYEEEFAEAVIRRLFESAELSDNDKGDLKC